MNVGYIGLGAMGGALARRLLAGHRLHVWDLSAAAVARFEQLGAQAAPTAAELARRCDVVLTCLPRTADVRQLIFGPGGLAEGLSRGALIIDQTSGVPQETREIAAMLAERGISMLDAPVAGGVQATQEGRVTIMVSGPQEAFERAQPMLGAITKNVIYCGGRLGDGQAIKLINNAMNAECRIATLEAVALGRKWGLSLAALSEAINQSTGRSRISQSVLPAILEDRAATDFALKLMVKDVDQALALGMQAGVPMPLANLSRSLLQIGVNTLGPDSRLEDVIGLVESMAGVRIADEGKAKAAAATSPEARAASERLVVGYVGLGAMGAALVRRMLQTRPVHVFDARPEVVQALKADGAIAHGDLPSLARACDVVMVCLPTSAVVHEVVFGTDGLHEGLACGKIVIDQTTGDPPSTRVMAEELERRGVALIDAPISGGPGGAAAGTIATLCGGPEDAFAKVRPILELAGPAVTWFGPSGNGHAAKLIKNMLGAGNRLIAYEGLALGVKLGLRVEDVARVVNISSGWSSTFERIAAVVAAGGTTATLRLELMVKDLDLGAKMGMGCGVPMVMASAVRNMVQASANTLGGDANIDEMAELFARNAGVSFRGS